MSGPSSHEQEPARPLLRVVKGDPSDEELAALVAVVSALGATQVADERKPRPEWSAPHRLVRTPLAPGWRSSALPR
ncbi:acyl-CoA carboxylase subunit epsilon [soil metagenome]